MTALETEAQISAHTEDLSVCGCFVETTAPFNDGTSVRVRIIHGGAIFAAEGMVAYSRPGAGMGVAFTSIEPGNVSILESWLTEAAEHGVPGGQP